MNIETPELLYLHALMTGSVANCPGASDFTGNDVIVLRAKIEGEIANRSGVGIPPDWREQAQAFIASGRMNTIAPSEAIRKLEQHKSRVEGNRLAALPANDMLAELGL